MNIIKKTCGVLRACFVVVALLAAFAVSAASTVAPAQAGDDGVIDVDLSVKPDPLDEKVEGSIDYLFKLLNDPKVQFNAGEIQPMLDFVVGMKTDPKDIAPARRFGGKGICLRKEVRSDLDTILRYFYNPDIPNFLLCPAVLRLSGWHEGSEFLTRERPLWEELASLDQPVLVRGTEYEATSPDSFAEAYYSYDLKRLIILLKHNGKNVAISVSEQDDKSDVGRKGAILDDAQWEYFYSGIEGLNKGGLSWMDTFMYRSGSVQIFVEDDAANKQASVFLFKWLKAGWASMNVVKRSHIYEGSLRYARSLSKVLESASLTPEELAEGLKPVTSLSKADVDSLIKEYARNFEIRFKDNPKLTKDEYAEVIADGGYAEVLDANARKSILVLEKLKSMLGMETLVDLSTSPLAEAPAPEAAEAEIEPES